MPTRFDHFHDVSLYHAPPCHITVCVMFLFLFMSNLVSFQYSSASVSCLCHASLCIILYHHVSPCIIVYVLCIIMYHCVCIMYHLLQCYELSSLVIVTHCITPMCFIAFLQFLLVKYFLTFSYFYVGEGLIDRYMYLLFVMYVPGVCICKAKLSIIQCYTLNGFMLSKRIQYLLSIIDCLG